MVFCFPLPSCRKTYMNMKRFFKLFLLSLIILPILIGFCLFFPSQRSRGAVADVNNVFLPLVFKSNLSTNKNIVKNPSYEQGTDSWSFFTNGLGDFAVISPGYNETKTAEITISDSSTNIQLFQSGLILEPNTKYRLEFTARSKFENDLSVILHKHDTPYINYGLANYVVNLTASWDRYSTEFTTTNFTTTINDARLRFWLAPYAIAGEKYYFDDIVLHRVEEDTPDPPPPPIGETYFVAKNNSSGCSDEWAGTENLPWCTIQHAADTLEPGSTVIIKEGEYNEMVEITQSGKAGQYITYQGQGNVVISNQNGDDAFGFYANNQSWLKFVGFSITFTGPVGEETKAGIWVQNESSHIVIDNVAITNSNYGIYLAANQGTISDIEIKNSFISANFGHGIQLYKRVRDSIIHDNEVSYSGVNNPQRGVPFAHGINFSSASDPFDESTHSKNVVVYNNHIHHNDDQGVRPSGCTDIVIRNNQIHHNGATGVQVEKGAVATVVRNNSIEYNSLAYNFEGGIWVDEANKTIIDGNIIRYNAFGIYIGVSENTIIRNNIVYSNNTGLEHNLNTFGIAASHETHNTTIVHNSLWSNGDVESDRGAMNAGATLSTAFDVVIKNNIVSESQNRWDFSQRSGSTFVSDHNNYYNNRALLVKWEDQILSWVEFLNASGQDNNSINTDPIFFDTGQGNFNLLPGSPAINSGGDLTFTTSAGSGTSIRVWDARYFFGGSDVLDGDLIQVGVNAPVQVIRVDYDENIIGVDTSIVWDIGDGVNYPYSGSAPDIGAYENN